jgi:hypothetical protein
VDSTETYEGVAATVGDKCAACGNRLASDQRYCLNCGDRRGKSRYPLTSVAASQKPSEPPPPRARRSPMLSSGATLIVGIATLLLAMGVGVLIGRSGNDSAQRASAPAVQVVTAPGAGAAPAAAAATAATHHKKKKAAASHPVVSKKVARKAQVAASKVIGGSHLPPPTVKVGQKGHGPGFTNGKFNGQFFGK